MASIVFDASLNTSQLDAAVRQSQKTVRDWATDIEKQASGIDKTMQRIGGSIAAYFSINALAGFAQSVISVRGEFQQLGIAFETMLGSKDKADKLMQEAIQFAAKTPFTLTDVATNIKQLMAMGIETENVMDTMKALGDVAAGVSVPISRVAINYGQVATMGKLQDRELRDFAMAGIPLIDTLANNLGKAKSKIEEMVSAGQIGFPLVEQAFKSMSSEGGKFFDMMSKQNSSVTGQISNLKDKWDLMLNSIGKSNEGIIYGGISGLSGLVANYKTVVSVIEGLVVVLGAAKVATILVAREQEIQAATALFVAQNTTVMSLAEGRAILMKERSAIAQEALNKSMLTNPYVLAAAAVAALGFALYKLATYQSDLDKAISKTNLEIENEKDKALELFSALKVTKIGTEEWGKARKTIIDQYGEYIPAQDRELSNLTQIKAAQDAVNKSIEENIAVKVRSETLQNISAAYNTDITDAQADIFKTVASKINKEAAYQAKMELAVLVASYKAAIADVGHKGLPEAEQALKDFQTRLSKEVGATNDQGGVINLNRLMAMADAFNPLTTALKGLQTETDAAKAGFAGLFTEVKKAPDATEEYFKALDKQRGDIQSKIADSQQKLFDMQADPTVSKELIASQTAELNGLQSDLATFRTSLEKQRQEAVNKVKSLANIPGSEADVTTQNKLIAGLDSQLSGLKTAVEERAKLVRQLKIEEEKLKQIEVTPSKDPLKAIQDQKDIIKGLQDQLGISAKEQAKEADKSTKAQQEYETESGRKIIQERLEIEQQKLDLQKDGADKQRKQAELDFQKRLVDIKNQQADELLAYNKSPKIGGVDENNVPIVGKYVSQLPQDQQANYDKLIVLAEQKKANTIVAINKAQAEELKRIYDEISAHRLTGIDKEKKEVKDKYDALQKEVSKISNPYESLAASLAVEKERAKANLDIDKKYALDKLDLAQQVEISQNNIAAQGFHRQDKLSALNFETFKKYAEKKITLLKSFGDVDSLIQAANLQNQIDEGDLRSQIEQAKKLASHFYDAADAAGYLADQIGLSSPMLANLLRGVSQLSGSIGRLAENGLFSEMGMSDDAKVSAAIGGFTQLLGLVAGQAAENKRVMADYYASTISQQQEYNLLLNEQIRLNSDIHDSVFLKDYEGSLNAGVAAYNDAQKKYNDAFKQFASAEAITGKKNVVSGTNVLSGAGAGAALGAGIGAIIPIGITSLAGAAIGGIVGALTGLFAKKKKDIVAPLLETYPDLIQANGEFNASLAQTLIDNNKVTDATKQTLKNLIEWKNAADEAKKQLTDIIKELAGSLGDDLRTALVTAFEDGTSASVAFGDSVNKVLENILSNMIFNKVFEQTFTDLENMMTASMQEGGDKNWLDDFAKFMENAKTKMPEFYAMLQGARDAAKDSGFDIFGSSGNSATASKGLSGQIARNITEDTGTELAGLFRRFADDSRAIKDLDKIGTDYLYAIAVNSALAIGEIKTVQDIMSGVTPQKPSETAQQTIQVNPVVNAQGQTLDTTDLKMLVGDIYNQQLEGRNFTKIGIEHLVGIENNTYNTVQELIRTNQRLDIIASQTKPVYSGGLGV